MICEAYVSVISTKSVHLINSGKLNTISTKRTYSETLVYISYDFVHIELYLNTLYTVLRFSLSSKMAIKLRI